jgi:hypothetical protein
VISEVLTSDLFWNGVSAILGGLGVGVPMLMRLNAGRKIIKEAIDLFDTLPIENAEIGAKAAERPDKHGGIAAALRGELRKITGLKL